jgi:hypothetical protein
VDGMRDSSARRPAGHPWRAVARGSRTGRIVVAAVAVLGLAVTGCSGEKKAPPPRSAPTPIANLNTQAMHVPRIDFCKLVPAAAISDALGGKPDSDTAYGNGDEVRLPVVGTDVVHEIGCSWTGQDGVAARAWLFARPVDAEFARTVVADARATKGCRVVPGSAYGNPTMTQLCQLPGDVQRVRHAGLFGDTWLTCELAATDVEPAGLRSRADRWCVEVVNALNTAR